MTLTVADVIAEINKVPAGTILVATACLILFGGIFDRASDELTRRRSNLFWAVATLFAITLAAAFGFGDFTTSEHSTHDLFRAGDAISRAANFLALLGGTIVVLLGFSTVPRRWIAEYYGCFLFLLSGLIFVGAANDLAAMVLGLELVSIPTTVILAMTRRDQWGSEATLKYFTLSAFASAIFLCGVSYLYGIVGTTEITPLLKLLSHEPSLLLKLAIGFVICGMCFRIAAVPFHFYAPDTFAGASVTGASVLAVAPKIAGFLVLSRILTESTLNSALMEVLVPVLVSLSVLTMTVGNIQALVQDSVRRMLAFSSIAHSGYILVALLAVIANGGPVDVIFRYLAAYTAMTLGAFAGLSVLLEHSKQLTRDDLRGFARRHPIVGGSLVVCFLSLIGMPLTAGFWAKLQVIMAALESTRLDLRLCAIIMGLNSALAAFYYLDVVVRLFLPPTQLRAETETPVDRTAAVACALCAIATVVWFIVPSWLSV